MEVDINLWGVLAAAVSSFVVGMIWYAPAVFGEKWRKLIKMDKKTMKKGPGGQAWILTVIGAFLQAFVLAHFTYIAYNFFGGDTSWLNTAVMTAVMMWGGFQLSMVLTHDSFEQRPPALSMLTAGHQFTTLVVMGVVIGVIGQ